MGNSEKPGFKKTVKAGIDKAKGGATAIVDKAKLAKHNIDAKARDALDAAYAAKKPEAEANLARIRKENRRAKPVAVLELLEDELRATEVTAAVEADVLTEAISLYVLTALEVHGGEVGDSPARKHLVDSVLIADSKAVKRTLKFGGALLDLAQFALELADEYLTGDQDTLDKVKKTVRKAVTSRDKADEKLSGGAVTNSIASAIIHSTNKALGPAPEGWPKVPFMERVRGWFGQFK
ncbi:MAG: hypothetical protein RLZ71_313 [Actinomycetota bacterium]|jgi:hypothetical protein